MEGGGNSSVGKRASYAAWGPEFTASAPTYTQKDRACLYVPVAAAPGDRDRQILGAYELASLLKH